MQATEMATTELLHLQRPFDFSSPFETYEFAALLCVCAVDVTEDEQRLLSKALVAQGCRYAVCAGVAAVDWDDAIDMAAVVAELGGERSADRLVMTTWHEALEDAIQFFFAHTAFEDFVPARRLVLGIGGTEEQFQELQAALRRAGGGRTSGCS